MKKTLMRARFHSDACQLLREKKCDLAVVENDDMGDVYCHVIVADETTIDAFSDGCKCVPRDGFSMYMVQTPFQHLVANLNWSLDCASIQNDDPINPPEDPMEIVDVTPVRVPEPERIERLEEPFYAL